MEDELADGVGVIIPMRPAWFIVGGRLPPSRLCKHSGCFFICTTVVLIELLTFCLHNHSLSNEMFVGRRHELSVIRDCLRDTSKAQLIILYGRRRVGKSTLIEKAVASEDRVLFFEGIEGARTQAQIAQFLDDLSRQTGRVRLAARSWREVFRGIGELVQSGRWTLVFDEFPWLGAGRTRIVSELKLYWDRWRRNPELRLILCGSVASFMVNHVVHSTALHNRKTLEMCLDPLAPSEAGEFISGRNIHERARLYMCLGGVPKYLEQLNPRRSLEQNLNRLCFTSDGFFVGEFETLFKEQFRSLKVYESIVAALAASPMSLSELSRRISVSKGGGFREQLENLSRAQFVRAYTPVTLHGIRRSRTQVYKLVDPFLIFYFRYIHPNRDIISRNRSRENLFRSIVGPTFLQYCGYAFERLCEDGMSAILNRLGIALADIFEMGPFFRQTRGSSNGFQIDWLIRRRDSVWNLIEMKYRAKPVGLEVVGEVKEKIQRLGAPDDVSIEPILVSASGVTRGVQKSSFFTEVLGIDDVLLL